MFEGDQPRGSGRHGGIEGHLGGRMCDVVTGVGGFFGSTYGPPKAQDTQISIIPSKAQ